MKAIHYTRARIVVCCVSFVLFSQNPVTAFHPPDRPELPNFDRRQNDGGVKAAAERRGPMAKLRASLPEVQVDFDEVVGSPKWIVVPQGLLSSANAEADHQAAAANIPANEAHRATKSFLQDHRGLFGHGPEALADARVVREFVTEHNGLRTVIWEQQLDGIPVFEGLLISHTTKENKLANISSRFVPNPAQAADAGAPDRNALKNDPTISAQEAVVNAARNIGETLALPDLQMTNSSSGGADQWQRFTALPLNGTADARLVWLPLNDAVLKLCWEVILTSRARGEMFRLLVDVQTGETFVRQGLTEYISDASYRVYTSDSPSPFSPGHSTPLTGQPPLVSRTLVTLSALNTNASPNGWIDDGVNETRGNNVFAHTDKDNNNSPDLPRPQGSPFRTFDFAVDLAQAPATYTNAAVTDLFYWCNWIHDRLYEVGFTEAAGNFQINNFGRGGLGNDALQADAQDGGGFNNANMSTPTDGSAPRMQMYIFDGPTPDRDGDFDHEIVIHEYVHGLSNRRVGGGVGLSALQSRGMGEGWSDWYALTLLSEPGDDVNAVYSKGGYATFQLSGLTQNYYFGIRRYPYSTDMTKNPLTFKDIDPAQASAHTGIPRSTIIGNTANAVHNMGEVWCVTLWEARANLISKYGYATGNQLILQLVTDGMNLSPSNPNFLQARNGIIQADVINNGGANLSELWAAFAKRGMGSLATSPASSTTTGLVESYVVPDSLNLSPVTGFTASGNVGGPFAPSSQNYTLANSGTNSLTWKIGQSSNWLNFSQGNGTLTAGATTNVTISLNASANALPFGVYTNTVRLTNETSGIVQSLAFVLRSGQRDYFTEIFDTGGNDLDNQTLTFTPDGSTNFYSVCREPASVFPTPNVGTNLFISDHSYTTVTLPAGTNVSIYGVSANVLYIGGGGYISLTPEALYEASLSSHFANRKVSGLLTHLHPSSGGAISFQTLSNRVAVTFTNVYDYNTSTASTFQMEMFFDGRIRITHLGIGTSGGMCGLSAGGGTPVGFQESDLTSYGPCVLPLTVTVPGTATEGDGVLVGQGKVNIFSPAITNLTVALTSSDNSEVTVPSSVTIFAGQTNATFDISIIDDSDLDGVQPANISASVPAYAIGVGVIQVNDNESATLSLTLPANVTEGVSGLQGTVMASAAPAANISVALLSSDPTEIQVPSSVVLSAGQTSAVFNITIVNDTQIDGSQSVIVTAQVPNWTSGLAGTVVHDNESTNLVVTLPASAREGSGVLANAGAVRIFGTLATNLIVGLLSSDTSELIVPSSVTILAGQTNSFFNVTIADDADIDGSQIGAVTASAVGFISGVTNMTVNDDETPPAPSVPSPAHLATNVIQTADLSWQSGAAPGEIITNDVYLGTTPSPGVSELLGSTTSTSWSLPNLLPQTTYYWKIVARKAASAPGPVWQFTTRGVDHFVWNSIGTPPVAAPKYVSTPFSVTITAKDVFANTVSNFTGQAFLSGISSATGGGSGTLVIQTSTSPVTNTVRAALNQFGIAHDFVQTAAFSSLNLSNYSTIILGMNGGSVQYADMAHLSTAVNAGAKLIILGGSSVAPYASGLNDFFIRVNTNNYGWITVAGTPDISVTAPAHPLAAGLPSTYNLVDTYATYYMARVADLAANTVAINGDGFPCLTTKPVGLGSVVLFINAPTDSYWINPGDSNVMRTVVSNAFFGVAGAQSIPITPIVSGSFVSGKWVGDVTVLAPTTNLVLRADDGNGHVGSSNPFEVALQNDISVSMTDSPDPVSLGGNITYTITVTNIGPANANGVVVSNILAPTATLVSVATSQGSSTTNGNIVVCNLHTLGADDSAAITIIATAGSSGYLTNQTFLSRSDVDAYLANNSAVAVTTVQTPAISINDVSVFEGNSGTVNATFAVNIFPVPATNVTVNFSTPISNGDFISTNGVLNFAPGQTNQPLVVQVNGDTLYELNDTFTVSLSGAVNATIADSQGVGTILNDDAMPTLSISDATLSEGNSGTNNAIFIVSLSAASGFTTTFNYATANGNALSGSDYISKSGLLTLPAGVATTNISVAINGDLQIETDEVFYLDLSSAVNAILLKREGVGLILNDDGLPGELDHFVWNAFAPTQYVGAPFSATITALDAFNNLATNFNGAANLSANGWGGQATNAILGNVVHSTVNSTANYTLGYSFTPNTNITVTHVRSYAGTKVSIWTSAGVLLASQAVNGPAGVWTETALSAPLALNAGSSYRVAFFTGPTGTYYYRTDGLNSFPNGTIVQSYQASGDIFPTITDSVRWWLVDLRYTVGAFSPGSVTPTISGAFNNGVWSGNLTVLSPATNLVLRADDGNGHSGLSSPFAVELRNDISVQMTDSPDPVGVGGNVTYTLTVTNIGPSLATGVVLTNFLPATASFVSVATSQGTSTTNGNLVICNLGSLSANSLATVSIVASTISPGSMTNLVTVSRGEADAFASNNSATAITAVQLPALSINNVSVTEGSSGSTTAVFTVSLSVPAFTSVAVNFATTNGSALAGSDYSPTNGILNFAPGETNRLIGVQIFGDTNGESSETFSVLLSNPINATISNAMGIGTIITDDVPPFFDDFEPSIDLSQWSSFGGTLGSTVLATNYGGSVSVPNSLWFGDASSRFVVSRTINTTEGGTIGFHLRFGSSSVSPWELLNLPGEGVTLEYTTNSGFNWDIINTYTTTNFYSWTQVSENLPTGAQSPATQFRWRQLSHSGTGYDHWALDNVGINLGPLPPQSPQILTQPVSQVVVLGAAASFSVQASGSSPLSYQWRRNTVNINGATNSSYAISSVQSNHLGAYSVLITNSVGFALSADAYLTLTAPATTTLSQGNLVLTLNNASGRIYSMQYRGGEIYRVGSFVSDWGLQTGTNAGSFVRNENGSGTTGQPMSLISANATNALYTGTYVAGGGNVSLTRNYTLVSGADLLRTTMTFQNNQGTGIALRFFETFDVDWSLGGTVYQTAADRYSIATNGASIQIGRNIITNSPVIMLGTVDSGAILSANSSSGIISSTALNNVFATGGADSNGAVVDSYLEIAREFNLSPGASATFVFDQSVATNVAQAEMAIINDLTVPPSPLQFFEPQINGANWQLWLGTLDGSDITPTRAAKIQFYGTTNLSLSSNWVQITNSSILTNGLLRVDGMSASNSPSQFFRAVETP